MEDWTEKYRPKTLSDVVGNERALGSLRTWVRTWSGEKPPKKRAVILSGKPGTGKTSSALALARDFKWTVIELNASDARNQETIKRVATAGAINETLDIFGNYQDSRIGGRKLIILDEADNLYEKIEKSEGSANDFSDRGGKKAIIETIKITGQPIILIVNDYYGLIKGGGESLRDIATVITFYEVNTGQIVDLLRRICHEENIATDLKLLQLIAEKSRGDVRSAVHDLQSLCIGRQQVGVESLDALGYRDREKIIFDALRDVFKTRNIQNLRDITFSVDMNPDTFLLWIVENLPREYLAIDDLIRGYDAVSKADMFFGRVSKRQYYGLWPYACDLMTGGVAVAKTRNYGNDRYYPPLWMKALKSSKPVRGIRDSVALKLGRQCSVSVRKSRGFILPEFITLFQNDIHFACAMKRRLNLSEGETEYLLGEKHAHKLKEILECAMKTDDKQVEIEDVRSDMKKVDEGKKEMKVDGKQPSLFDF